MRRSLYEEENDFKSKGINLELSRELTPLLRPHLAGLAWCGIILLAYSLLSIVGPLLIRRAIDVNFVQKDLRGLLVTVGLFTLTLIGSFFTGYWQRIRLERIGQKIIRGLREELFGKITHSSLAYFNQNSVGSIISRIESDTEALRMLFTETVVTIIGDLLVLVGMFVVMFAIHWKLAAILFTIMPILTVTIYYYNTKGAPLFLAVRKQTAVIYGFLEEHIRGMSIVQAFSRESTIANRLAEENRRKMQADLRTEVMVILFFNFIFFMSTVGSVLVLWFGSGWVAAGSLSIGTLVMFLTYIRRFFGPLMHLSEQINVIQRAFAGAERIVQIRRSVPLVSSPANPQSLNGDGESTIRFEHVWFAYEGENWVLRDVDFTVPAGGRWALVGATGGGKTSVINLLFRFYDPQKGRILLNGIDIRELDLDSLRARMGLVLQDIYLFPADIRDNLRMERESIADAEILAALRTVQAEDFITRQPSGLDTVLAERGGGLSLGERQLLSFARALVKNPGILILDEATSSVDPLTEQKIQAALQVLLKGRTSIIIAHRLQTILMCDRILVIHDGAIAERGNHNELMARKGLYYNLYQLQHHDEKSVEELIAIV